MAVSLGRSEGTHSETENNHYGGFKTVCSLVMGASRPFGGTVYIWQLNERVVTLLLIALRAVCFVQESAGVASGTQPVLNRTTGKGANSSGTRRAWHLDRRFCLKEMQGYDIRNDEALPDLQTATNQKDTRRNCAVRVVSIFPESGGSEFSELTGHGRFQPASRFLDAVRDFLGQPEFRWSSLARVLIFWFDSDLRLEVQGNGKGTSPPPAIRNEVDSKGRSWNQGMREGLCQLGSWKSLSPSIMILSSNSLLRRWLIKAAARSGGQ